MCTALVYVDDATSPLMVVRFTATDSTFSYIEEPELPHVRAAAHRKSRPALRDSRAAGPEEPNSGIQSGSQSSKGQIIDTAASGAASWWRELRVEFGQRQRAVFHRTASHLHRYRALQLASALLPLSS